MLATSPRVCLAAAVALTGAHLASEREVDSSIFVGCVFDVVWCEVVVCCLVCLLKRQLFVLYVHINRCCNNIMMRYRVDVMDGAVCIDFGPHPVLYLCFEIDLMLSSFKLSFHTQKKK